MKAGFLKNALTLYLSTGMMAGMICLICFALFNYRNSLENWMTQLASITVKTVKMKTEVVQMDKTMAALHTAVYPLFGKQPGREALLAAVDETRRMLRGGTMTLGDIRSDGGEQVLPVTLTIDNARYTDITSCIGYLQKRAIPYVSIRRLAIVQSGSEAAKNRVNCALEVLFRMPDDGTTL